MSKNNLHDGDDRVIDEWSLSFLSVDELPK